MNDHLTPGQIVEVGPGPTVSLDQVRDPHRGGYSYEASMLRLLLASIHGDGGNYVEQHGLDKALEDAEKLVADWRADVDASPAPMALVKMSPQFLAQLLQLPAGAEIDAVDVDLHRRGVLVLRIRGAGWPTMPGDVICEAKPVVYTRAVEAGHVIDWRFPEASA